MEMKQLDTRTPTIRRKHRWWRIYLVNNAIYWRKSPLPYSSDLKKIVGWL